MVLAGDLVKASDPPRRIITDVQTSVSPNIQAVETTIHSVTADLIQGGIYSVMMLTPIASTNTVDAWLLRIREDSTTGQARQTVLFKNLVANLSDTPGPLYCEYVAVATGAKTFVGTLVRASGNGISTRNSSTTSPSYMFIDRIS